MFPTRKPRGGTTSNMAKEEEQTSTTETSPSPPADPPVDPSPKPAPAMASPRASPRRRDTLPGDDDPASELNSLRRELRHAQAELRESGLQAAAQQEEVCNLRQELREVENARDDAIARESEMRTRLVAERERVNATMSAAENLVRTLRDMEACGGEGDDEEMDARIDARLDARLDAEDDPGVRETSPSDEDGVETDENDMQPKVPVVSFEEDHHDRPGKVPVVSFEDLRVSSAATAPPAQPSVASVPRARSHPPIRPRSTKLLASAFSTHVPTASTAVRRAVSDEYAAGSLPVPVSAPAVRLPTRVSHIESHAHAGEIFCAAASLDGSLLATGGDDRTVRISNLRAPAPAQTIDGLPKSATAAEFLPDEAGTNAPLLAVGTADGAVRLYRRAAKRRARWTMDAVAPVHTAAVRRIAFRPDAGSAACVLTAGADRSVKLTDLRSGTRVFVAQAPSATLDVAPLHGGSFISSHRDGALRLWSPRAGSEPTGEAARVHTRAAVSVAPLDDGRGVVSLGRDNALRVSDTRMNLRVVHELEGGVETVSDWHRVAVDGRFAYCGMGPSGDLGVWNVDSGKLVKRLSSAVDGPKDNVIELVAKSLSKPAAVVVPLWSNAGRFVCAHRTRMVSYWDA